MLFIEYSRLPKTTHVLRWALCLSATKYTPDPFASDAATKQSVVSTVKYITKYPPLFGYKVRSILRNRHTFLAFGYLSAVIWLDALLLAFSSQLKIEKLIRSRCFSFTDWTVLAPCASQQTLNQLSVCHKYYRSMLLGGKLIHCAFKVWHLWRFLVNAFPC